MNITKRLFTYPVLNEDSSDYLTSKFDLDVKCRMSDVNTVTFDVNIMMDNEELLQLVANGDAEYVIHIECTATSYREMKRYITCENHRIDVPASRINGKVEVLAMFVLKNDVSGLKNKDWNEDYEDFSFDLAKGTILAYNNIPAFDVVKKYEELSNATSIFKIIKKLTDDTTSMEVDLSTDFIHIWLGAKDYKMYSNLSCRSTIQPILNALIITPALVYVFEELRQENGIENYEYKKWFVSLVKSYEKRGINFIDVIINSEKTSVELAQEAMEFPLNTALKELTELFDNVEESDDE